LGVHFTCGRGYHTIYAFSSAISNFVVRTVVFFPRLGFVGQAAVAALKLLTGSADGFLVGDFVCR